MNKKSLEVAFFEKVEIIPFHACWEWIAYKNKKGYGTLNRSHHGEKEVLAHRLSWTMHNGKIPNNKFVLHRCDNPSCVNPKHLCLGTNKENMKDMVKKKRHANRIYLGEKHPMSKLSAEDVLWIRDNYVKDIPGKKKLLSKNNLRSLGERFGVSMHTIHDIITRKSWSHI